MRPTPTIDLHLLLVDGPLACFSLRAGTGFEDGKFSLVAGHLEANETLSQGMQREAREEIGIEIASEDLLLVHTMHNRSNSDRIAFFFRCTTWAGTPTNQEPNKCAELRWMDLGKLHEIDNVVDYIRFALQHVAKGIPYSEFGGWHVR